MKRFVFTLESVLKYKQTIEKTQKTALAETNARLNALRGEEREILESFTRTRTSQRNLLRNSTNIVSALQGFDLYFQRLRSDYASLLRRINIVEAEKEERIKALLETTRELKAYNKLRDEQYSEYLREVRAEEEREMSELVARKAAIRE